jgi:hypothetical protein
MKYIKRSRWVGLAAIAAALLLARAPSADVARGNDGNDGLPTESVLTAKFSEWLYSIPVSQNPSFDETGEFAAIGQPYKGAKVFFLCGVTNVSGTATRTITVPQGTAFFFPIVAIEWDNIGIPASDRAHYLTVPELRDFVETAMDGVTDIHVTLDGNSLLDLVDRVQSPPFAYHLPAEDNIYQFFGADFTGTVAPAVSDGFWVYLTPLSKGKHKLHFGASVPDVGFTLDITYYITVE